MHKKINKNLLLGFIAPYIFVVLIVFTAQYISNSIVLNALKSNALDIAQSSFENNITVMEQNLDRVKETAVIVAQNTALHFDDIDRSDVDFYSRLTAVKDELSSYYVGNGVIKDICIQSDAKDYLVNFDVAYSSRMGYYKTMVSSGAMSAEELLRASETANGFSTENACIYSGDVRAIPFVFPTPILRPRTGSVMVYVDEKALLLPLDDLLAKSGGALKVFDEEGRIVAACGEAEVELTLGSITDESFNKRIDGTNYYIISKKGPSSRWQYVALLPESYVLSGVRYYQLFSLAFNFLVLLMGFAICLFFTARKSGSYLELLEILGIQPQKFAIKSIVSKDEYSGLRQHITKIKDENTELLEKGNQNLLRRIINGQFEKAEEIKKELKSHKMEFSGSRYGVMVIKHTGRRLPEENVKSFESFIVGEIQGIIPEAKVCFIEKNIIVVLFSFDKEDYRQLVNLFISRMKHGIFFKYHIQAVVCVGECAEELTEIPKAYSEACEAVSYNLLMEGKNLIFYSDLPTEDDNYYYPIEMENALFKSIIESNFENARDILRKIQEENFANKSLSLSAINELLAELRASIKKACRLQTDYLEFSQEKCSVNHFFEYVTNFIYTICQDADNEKVTLSRGRKLCQEIQNYIELYYNDSNLSLDKIADEFRIHRNYLSTLFKKHTGSNLMSYIENLRVEKAEELLSSGRYTVNEVAASVGFSSDSTFRRSFKRIKGVPPSTYMKS